MLHPNRLIVIVLGFGLLGAVACEAAWGDMVEFDDAIDAASEVRLPPDAMMLKLRLDGFYFDPILIGYTRKSDVLLPLGQVAELLGLAIAVVPSTGQADGFVLSEDRDFALDVKKRTVHFDEHDASFKSEQLDVQPDDIYVSAKLLSQWLPVDFSVDVRSALVSAQPREPLPIQQRLQRENRTIGGGDFSRHYPKAPDDYLLIEQPYLDVTFSGEQHRDTAGRVAKNAGYSMYGASDFLYHTTSFYLIGDRNEPLLDYRFSMGRKATDATLLGPLHAMEYQLGDFEDPSMSLVSQTRHVRGAAISNFPFYLANQLDRHSFRGALQPGWDVELRQNDTLIAYQPAGAGATYHFDDVPLYAGVNRFELIFYGPQGQIRSESNTFLLDGSFAKPGQIYYRFEGGLQDDGIPGFQTLADKNPRASAQIDVSLFKPLTATFQGTTFQLDEQRRQFGKAGLRAHWRALLFRTNYVVADDGGQASENAAVLGMGWANLAGEHTQFRRFTSEIFMSRSDYIKHRSAIQIDTMPISMRFFPITLGVGSNYEHYESRTDRYQALNRVGLFLQHTSVSNQLHWTLVQIPNIGGTLINDGTLYVSRRIYEIGVSGTLQYALYPVKKLDSASVNTEWRIGNGYFLTFGGLESMAARSTTLFGGMSKNLGNFTAGVTSKWSDQKEWAVNLLFSFGIGRDPYRSNWFAEATPIGNSGAVAPRAFLDTNQNGRFDSSEQGIPGATFFVNGSSSDATTAENGHAHLGNLTAYQPVEIGISPASLPDAAMFPVVPGASFLPRPGHTSTFDVPVIMAGEIDGTLLLQGREGRRELPNITMEIINQKGKIIKREKTAFDGYFWFQQIPPGDYSLRPSPAEIAKLGQEIPPSMHIHIGNEGTVVNGMEIVIGKKAIRSIRNLLSFRPKAAAEPTVPQPALRAATPPATPRVPLVKLTTAQSQLLARIETGKGVILPGVEFLPGTTFPKMGAMNKLLDIIAVAKARPDLNIELLVHADMMGAKELVQKLSEDRAHHIERFLTGQGSQIQVIGMGNSKPIALGFSFKGKEKNNRVEARRRP